MCAAAQYQIRWRNRRSLRLPGNLTGEAAKGTEMRKHMWKWVSLLTVGLAVVLLAPQRAAADEDDPPGRVARLSYTRGEVSFEPAGTDEWVSAVINRPLTTEDKLWTDREARAELHIGSAAIRMKGETGFSFLNLTDRIVQIRLTTGTINVRLRRLEEDEIFEVDTPNLAFSLLRPGDYRIEVNEAGDATVVTVRRGEGEVTGGGQAYTVHAQERATFYGTEDLDTQMEDVGGYDEFDDWCRERDAREQSVQSSHYVSRDVIGYEDLDEYGEWRPTPDYGYVWVPRTVVVGWAPYRFGHWVWISPWGWTWVDDAPWGFAPFHYGRWVYWGGEWAWVPGPARVRPVYAPALVVWVGGPHFRLSLSSGHANGGVAWFPLGPREVYVPPYRVSNTYVTNVNVTNTTVNNIYVTNVYNNVTTNKVTNIRYVNRGAPGSVTATSQQVFASAQPVHANLIQVNAREVATAPVSTGAAIVPQQRSILGVGAAHPGVVRPPAAMQNRPVVARTEPPPRPVPFASQQKALQENEGRPLNAEQMQKLRPAVEAQPARPNIRVAPPVRKPLPVEMARPRSGAPDRPGRPPVTTVPARPPEAAKPAPPAPPSERTREDRPPSAQRPPAQAPPMTVPARPSVPERGPARNEDRPPVQTPPDRTPSRSEEHPQPPRVNEHPDRPPQVPQASGGQSQAQQRYEAEQRRLEQKHQQEQQKLQERQQHERQKLEQQQQRQRQKEQQKSKAQEKPQPKPPVSNR